MTNQHIADVNVSSFAARRLKRSALMLSAAAAAIALAQPAFAQSVAPGVIPTGGTVVAGDVTIGTTGPGAGAGPSTMTIGQTSNRAVINWNGFDIGSASTVTFNQPSASAIAVNRVVSGELPSRIEGKLTANGVVAILNPNGVLFAGSADVDVGGMIASTGDIDTAAFMGGGNLLNVTGADKGEIVVQGDINITAGALGLAAFVAPTVRNSGTITATAGRVQLGAGTAFTLDLAGDGLLSVNVGAQSALVQNNGGLFAAGGQVQLSARQASALVDQTIRTGVLPVASARLDGNTIVLDAGAQDVNLTSNIAGRGDLTIKGAHLYGTGDVNVAGALTLNVNATGAATSATNWINDAIGLVGTGVTGTTVTVPAGNYLEGAAGVGTYGGVDGQNFGLFVPKDNVTIRGVDASGNAVSSAAGVGAYITAAYQTGFGAQHFVSGSNVTLEGLGFRPAAAGDNKTLEVIGNNFTLRNSVIDNRGNETAANLYIDDFDEIGHQRVESFNVTGNIFYGGTYSSAIVVVGGGVGRTTDATNRVFADNNVIGTLAGQRGFQIQGRIASLGWQLVKSGAVTITGNRFDVDIPVRTTGLLTQDLAWNDVFLNNGNSFVRGGVLAYQGSSTAARGIATTVTGSDGPETYSDIRITSTIADSLTRAQAGDTVRMLDGTYTLGNTLLIDKRLSLVGASTAGTILDASALGVYGMRVHADGVSLSNFTLLAPGANTSSTYGIKVEVGAGDTNNNARIDDFAISNVAISGSRKTGLDLNAVVGATIDGVSVSGAIAGNGISITDSANVTVRNSTTSGNAWGGLALYQANRSSDQQLTGISIEASNSFGESAGLYLQDSSASKNPGTLGIAGFDYAVRGASSEYTFFRKDLADATAYAATLGTASSSIEGWSVAGGSNVFTVQRGYSIASALRDVRAGGTINVGAGTYVGNLLINKAGITLASTDGRDATTIQGVAGTGALGAVTISSVDNVTLGGTGHGFTIIGFDSASPAVENATLYLQGNNANTRVQGNRITAAGDLGMESEYGAVVSGLTVNGNIFDGKTYVGSAPATGDQWTVANVSRQLISFGGGQGGGNTSSLVFTNNQVIGDSGLNTAATLDSRGATITGNRFASTTGGYGSMLRVRGTETVLSGNVFDMAGVAATASGLYFRDVALTVSGFGALLGGNTVIGAGAWADNSATGYHTLSRSVNGAVLEAASGAIVTVRPGDYVEGITGVNYVGGAGGETFGLYVAKDNITIRGVDAAGIAITDSANVLATINSRYQTGFQAQHFISGQGVTIEGLRFTPLASGDGKTMEVIGNGFTLRNSVIDNRGSVTQVALYMDDFQLGGGRQAFDSFTLSGNIFYGADLATGIVTIAGGVGLNTAASNRVIDDNSFIGTNRANQSGIRIRGQNPSTGFDVLKVGPFTVTNNLFTSVNNPLRATGAMSSELAWDDIFRNNGNNFGAGGAAMAYQGDTLLARAVETVVNGVTLRDYRIATTISQVTDRAQSGDTVRLLDGTYNLGTAQLALTRSINLIGQSQAGVILDGRQVSNGGGLGTILVAADNTTLSNFTLYGSEGTGGNYGIKVQPNPLGYTVTGGMDQRINNVTISDVTVRGSRRAELDINGAVGVTVTNFTADGRSVATGALTGGAGVQITDSAGVTLTGVHTLGNDWGGVALYQTNRAGGYNGQTTDITIDAASNRFDEALGLFSQLESATQNFGTLNLAGFDYAVRNTGHRSDGAQFTYFRTTLDDATRFALGMTAPTTSSIEGYTGTGLSNAFTVVNGLTIAAAARDVRTGGTINVGAGTYASGAVIGTAGVSLIGSAGARIDASHSGDNGVTIDADGVTVRGFEIFGPADQSYVSYAWPTITRGIVLRAGADNATIAGNTIHDVRNGILVDGPNPGAAITDNLIDNTKSAISVQYSNGAELNISGNRAGAFGNEWGVIVNLQGGGALGAATPLAEQQRLLALRDANNGFEVMNRAYTAGNRTAAYVAPSGTAGADGSPRTLATLQGGLDAVVSGGTVHIAAGNYAESVTLNGLRVLDMPGAITVNDLSFGAGAAGTNIGTQISASGALSFADGLVLGGDTSLSAGSISLAGITSPYALNLAANIVTISDATLASLAVSGGGITAANITTSGAQLYDGNANLSGSFAAGGGFGVTGATVLGGDTSVTTGNSSAALGTVSGAHALQVSAGEGSVTLGAVRGLTGLTVTGGTIMTAGAQTSGDQAYSGASSLTGAYATGGGDFAVNGTATLAGDTDVTTNGGDATFGALSGGHALAVDAGTGAVALNSVEGLASLSATGAQIVTLGAATLGGQSYTGATLLQGGYTTAGGDFAVAGTATLGSDASVATSGGALGLGSVAGDGHGLALDAGTGAVALGGAAGLSSLSATAATIATSNVVTSGAQTYTGGTSLNGSYATGGGSFTVNGVTTTVNVVTLTTTGGDARFGTVGGAGGLTIAAGTGTIALGSVSGIASLDLTGGTITTAGASTSGAQRFNGATTLGGNYAASSFTVIGATTLADATGIAAGAVALGTVAGAQGLTIDSSGSVVLGAVNDLTALSVTGATIASNGARTSGAQRYFGATTLNGSYLAGSFGVNGTTTLGGTTSITTSGGTVALGTIGGGYGLAIDAGTGSATLGAVNGLAGLSVSAATIASVGGATSGAQLYTGTATLQGSYTTGGNSFAVNGTTVLGGALAVTTGGGSLALGSVSGPNGLTLDAGSGAVALGQASGLASLSVTGATIASTGASTTGAQSYSGATSLAGSYATNGGSFAVNGATTLSGTTSVASGGGSITLGTVDAAIAGNQGLSLAAGTGTVAIGTVGAVRRLGPIAVNAAATLLNGAGYTATSISFTGATGSTVRLTQGTTSFTTAQALGTGGAITIQPNLIGTANGQQNVVFNAGSGLAAGSGDVAIGNAGSDAVRLGAMSVTAHDFSAATVKLAGNFASVLSGSQLFSANTLDTLGSVTAQVAGNEAGPIRAGGSVTIDAQGSGTGSIIAGGPVALDYGSNVVRAITSTGSVSVASDGAIGGSISAGSAVNLSTGNGSIASTVNAGGPVTATTTGGSIAAPITSTGAVTLGTGSGAITGTVNAGGPVSASTGSGAITSAITTAGSVALGSSSGTIGGTVNATGPVSIGTTSGTVASSVTSQGATTISSTSGAVNATVTGSGEISVTTRGPITGTYSTPTEITLTSSNPVEVQVNGAVVNLEAPGGTVTGVFNEIHTDDNGSFLVNDQPVIGRGTTNARQIIIDSFLAPLGAGVNAAGEIQLPVGLALGLIAPAGNGKGGQRPPVLVNHVDRLGELLRQGYTAIIIDLDESNLDLEEELNSADR
jgi:filamentous hemagglutinin family protein